MTDEEIDELMQEISEQIEQLPDDAEKPLSKADRKHKVVLQGRSEALGRIKAAREKGNLSQEVKASMDYALLTEHGEKNFFLLNFLRARMGWWRGI
jgi:hypothetical protein